VPREGGGEGCGIVGGGAGEAGARGAVGGEVGLAGCAEVGV
jgi:hypothetical protein